MEISWGRAMWRNFLGQSPDWYKLALLVFLIVNPFIFLANPFIAVGCWWQSLSSLWRWR